MDGPRSLAHAGDDDDHVPFAGGLQALGDRDDGGLVSVVRVQQAQHIGAPTSDSVSDAAFAAVVGQRGRPDERGDLAPVELAQRGPVGG